MAGLTPSFVNQPLERKALYWEHQGNRAIRIGDWKLVSNAPVGKRPQFHDNDERLPLDAWELYNLAEDRGETRNLSTHHPDRVAERAELWQEWARTHHVVPKPQMRIYRPR